MRYLTQMILAVIFVFGLTGQLSKVAAEAPETLDVDNLPEWRVTTSSLGGKLLLSDSPEMVQAEGILYQDKVEGNVRLFFYHVNAADTAKRAEVMLENSGSQTAHVTIQRYGMGGPGFNWMAVGKEALTSYLMGSTSQLVNVPAGGAVPLSARISDTAVLPNMLINGIFDFVADRPVTVKVMMMPVLADSEEFSRKAKILAADEAHLRGTFDGANRRLIPTAVYDPERDGVAALTLADNEVDHYIKGIDATDGAAVLNYGNYGVVYEIVLPSINTGKVACYLAPMGGAYAGAIGVKYRQVDQAVATPSDRIYFGDHRLKDFAFLGVFDGSQSLTLTFSPPGGSELPVKLIISPQ